MYGIVKYYFVILITLVMAMASCGRHNFDLSVLKEGAYYVAQYNNRDAVLYVDEVTEKTFKGKWYVEGDYFAKPHHFEATSGLLRWRGMRSDSLIVKTNAMAEGNALALDILLDGSWRTLRFLPWRQSTVMNIFRGYPYHDNLFEVTVDSNIIYAYAKGYWASYPEPEYDCDNYLPILMEKWTDAEEMTLKDVRLTMDIYSPVATDSTRRPLLMLIHGGAFFNGDKKATGYVEWANYFASRGYVVASINYRLGFQPYGSKHIDRAGYRAVQDAHAAMSYLLRNSKQYCINPNYLFVAGTSAGAITALNLAFMTDYDRPDCTYAGPINYAYDNMTGVFPIFRNEMRRNVGLEDLGGINTVADEWGGSVGFKINTVVNMWGAVHKIEMIDTTSPGTAILSFHGDADHVVAYDYDFPFTNTEPFNQFLCNKMYGSKSIHERALANGRKSELHTKIGGGHSLHSDCSELTDYFTLITDTTMRFLYSRMFPRPTLNSSFSGRQQWFEIDNAGEAKGGLVLETMPDKARVIFFDDAPEHKIRIIGRKKNEESYDESYNI